MPTYNEFRGDAPAVSDRVEITVNDSVEGALYQVELLGNATVSTRGADGDTVATIAGRLAGLLENVDQVDVTHVTGTSLVVLTGETAGIPISQRVSGSNPAGSFVERVRAGVLPVEQEWLVTLPETTTGGTFKIKVFTSAEDTTGEETTTQAWNDSPGNLESDLDNLASFSANDWTVTLEDTSPRTYRLKLGGDWAGKSGVSISVDAKALLGNATVEIETTRTVAGTTANEIQGVWVSDISGSVESEWITARVSVDGGATWSDWTTQPFNNTASQTGVLQVADAIEAAYGAGSVTITFQMNGTSEFAISEAMFLLKFTDTAPHQQIQVEVRNEQVGRTPQVTYGRLQTGGGSEANEFTVVNISNEFGNYKLTFDGSETSGILLRGSSNAQIVAALETTTSIGSGDAIVHRGNNMSAGLYLIELANNLANANQSAITMTSVAGGLEGTISTYADGSGGQNEIQRIIIRADGGTLQYSHDGNGPTVATDFNEVAATVQSRLEGLSSIGSGGVTLTGSGTVADPFYAEYINGNAGTDMALITATTASLTGGKLASVSTPVSPVPGANEVQAIRIDPNSSGGTIRLGYKGQFTDDETYNQAIGTTETALEAVSTIGANNVSLDGTWDHILVEFQNDLGQRPVERLVIDQDLLAVSGGSALSVSHVVHASGENHWNNPGNWTLGHVPNSAETVILGSGDIDILYGLVQSAECTFSGTDVTLSQLGNLVDDQIVRLKTAGSFPTAEDSGGSITLSASTDYYIVSTSVSDAGKQVVKISETENGEPIEFTSAGSGTHRIEAQLSGLEILAKYSGQVGWNRRIDGEWFDGQRFLQIGLEDPTAGTPNVQIGAGEGRGSSLLNLDFGTSHVDARLLKSQGGNNEPAINLRNDNLSDSEVIVIGGTVGAGLDSEVTPQVKRWIAFSGRSIIGNMNFGTVESYNNSVEFTSAQASGSTLQLRA